MTKMLLIFAGMLSLFIGTWTVKVHSPIHPAYSEQTDYSAGAWWIPGSDEVDPEWVLDPEIPENYLPVPGEEELYMVIDNDGNILGYRQPKAKTVCHHPVNHTGGNGGAADSHRALCCQRHLSGCPNADDEDHTGLSVHGGAGILPDHRREHAV